MGLGAGAKWYQLKGSKEPQVLEGRDIPSLAKYIASDGCKNVVLMLGAGVSTSAGIPDFRSPKTGLYSNLARLNLPHPEAVFEIDFFRRNPVPFYTLAHELYPGKFRPTLAHSFIHLLERHSLLHTCFTQNIDTLERRAGVSESKIVEAHGSFASQRCIDCGREFDGREMRRCVRDTRIARCRREGGCGGLVKPDIVFFGESLPPRFISSIPALHSADLLIIMGTSLTVHPFASLASIPDSSCPRVLINLDRVGDLGTRMDDVLLLGKCDEMVRELCRALGWEQELEELWARTEGSVDGGFAEDEEDGEVDAEGEEYEGEGEEEYDEEEEGEEEVEAEFLEFMKEVEAEKRRKEKARESVPIVKTVQEEVDSITAAIERSLALTDAASPELEPATAAAVIDARPVAAAVVDVSTQQPSALDAAAKPLAPFMVDQALPTPQPQPEAKPSTNPPQAASVPSKP